MVRTILYQIAFHIGKKALLKITEESKADIVFMDGSINSQALWNARIQQLKISPYIVPDTAIDLYSRIFQNPDGLWSKVIERLKSDRVVWIPKRIVGKSFVNIHQPKLQ